MSMPKIPGCYPLTDLLCDWFPGPLVVISKFSSRLGESRVQRSSLRGRFRFPCVAVEPTIRWFRQMVGDGRYKSWLLIMPSTQAVSSIVGHER